jgi:segregation and condensation protein B
MSENVPTGDGVAIGEDPAATRTLEALLFLSPDPLSVAELAEAARLDESMVEAALAALAVRYPPGERGIVLRELGGGFTFASDPSSEDAARRLFSRPRVATLSPAQAETLAIVAYLQPVSRPEITRIRGVSTDSATVTLLERGLIEEAGRSQFGAVLYRTSTLFLKLFGLPSLEELPDVAQWDPTPEEHAELRERLLRAGDARGGGGAPGNGSAPADEDPSAVDDLPAGEDFPAVDDLPAVDALPASDDRPSSESRPLPE